MTSNDVLATIESVYAAWAANDADAFVADYAPDATATLPGAHLAGRDAIHATMVNTFANDLKGSRAHHQPGQVRFPTADVAVVNATSAVQFAGQDGPDDKTRTLDTWVLARRDGRWWIEAFHSAAAAG
ncbi:MAG TPA: SgcJ/EcaC family oxidoreductase [Pseudonocardiaceae bacterium]|nr:SgcJ/EcaC family oxidoreductase [Pseudonocardiaceae bacterium]